MPWFERDGFGTYFEEHGSGDPLFLLHGWAGNMDDLATVRGALSPSYRVIAVDTPGCGRSQPKPREYVASYHHDDAATFLALLEELRRRLWAADGGYET
jgi:valacyclovir hydrolase